MEEDLRKALREFEDEHETEAIEFLEEFFKRKIYHLDENEIKGKKNSKKYKDFCKIADDLSSELGYDYTIYFSSDDDEEDEIDFKIDKFDNCYNSDDEEKSYEELLNELNSLTGLNRVKEEINSIIGIMKINEQREKQGLNTSKVSLHLVFSGNPGTGKTTVARLLAKIYKEIGVLSTGNCIETDYAGLVSEYISETPKKTRAVVKQALGGILFIDEAYTLTPIDNPGSHGQEAIDTLLKYMEDNRDDFMVIAAGYPNEMDRFVKSNPGLESRFTTVIHFEDYNAEELYEIFMKMATSKDKQFVIPSELNSKLKLYFERMYNNRKENFANAREVRNYLEECVKRQAARLAKKETSKLTKEDLTILTEEDLGVTE